MLWVIPMCHCRNHIPSCELLFLYAYKESVREFKGETAKHIWDYLNGIGPLIQQMNLGTWEDTLNLCIGDWNYQKTVGIGKILFHFPVELIKIIDSPAPQL
ncbi:hypothetical protein L218DRAFT_881158 [Marasmius fiardii PR-910]|nr:hypothetical protein L218DRAFT_881158 [Marasmius fiardii PR-910]